jgi:glycerol transport system ATP-binding protein
LALVLDNISRAVDGVTQLADIDLSFEPGSFNVLLGRTLAG